LIKVTVVGIQKKLLVSTNDRFFLSGVIELPDLRPMGFDSGAELGLSGEDQSD
jgi:hypothetical protein